MCSRLFWALFSVQIFSQIISLYSAIIHKVYTERRSGHISNWTRIIMRTVPGRARWCRHCAAAPNPSTSRSICVTHRTKCGQSFKANWRKCVRFVSTELWSPSSVPASPALAMCQYSWAGAENVRSKSLDKNQKWKNLRITLFLAYCVKLF